MNRFDISNRRYLGSKTKLLPFIHEIINENCKDIHSIADIFGGTGVVGYSFFDNYDVIINDILESNIYAYETFFSNERVYIKKLEKYLKKYNNLSKLKDNYYSKNFSNTYLSKNNMRKVGYIRDDIDKKYNEGEINSREKACLITSLLYAIDRIANTVGHYDAYRKNGDLKKDLHLIMPNIKKHSNKYEIYKSDSNELVKKINADLVYIDPPYNSRQYCDAYHFLENVAANKKPEVYGIAKKMDRSEIKSRYCSSKASDEFEKLIKNINSKYILVSYNNTGNKHNDRSNAKISDVDLKRILSKKGKIKVFETEYNLYTTGKSVSENHKERLFLCITNKKSELYNYSFEMVQSPLNYTGGKYKLLKQIMQYFPKDVEVFYDVFCGAANVGANVDYKKIVCIDNNERLIELLNYLKRSDYAELIENLENKIRYYELSDTFHYGYDYYNCNSANGVGMYNKKGFKHLKDDYNNNLIKFEDLFLLLIIYSFNNQIRFNSKGEYNLPVGKRDFNSNQRKKLKGFINNLHYLNIDFVNQDFRNIKISKLTKKSFLYLDPPYYLGNASYNENGGWTLSDEKDLLNFLFKCNKKGIRFALSNVIEHKGLKHKLLYDWANINKFNIHYLDKSYSNSSYHIKNRKQITKEVLITNY